MEQKTTNNDFLLQDRKCVKNNLANFVCTSKQCNNLPFLCNQIKCCCYQKHSQCLSMVVWDKVLKKLSKKRLNKTQETKKSLERIRQLFDNTIEQISKERELFIDWSQNLGLSINQIKFLKALSQNNIEFYPKGSAMHQLTQSLVNCSDVQSPIIDQRTILSFQRQHNQQLQSMVNSIRSMYTRTIHAYPCKNSSIVENTDCFNSLFTVQPLKYRLLYKGTAQQFSVQAFHTRCDDVKNTLTVILGVDGSITGGIASVAWKSSQTGKWVIDNSASIIKGNKKDLKFTSAKSSNNAIFTYKKWGPTFGGGTDLVVYQKKEINQQLLKPESYGGRSFQVYTSKHASSIRLKVEEIQVFQVIWAQKKNL